ncbi:MAG TPA: UbiX family flavin prenyltransferase [Verrucomicrobiae bacterium]|nr:UbiX family flavin prenyltransferase [Verrucomicrobiae bacterium]
MKLVIAMTGASGAIYTQRLLDNLDPQQHEIHFIATTHAREVAQLELPKGELKLSPRIIQYREEDSMFVPFVSGSARFDAMVVIPASMGTIGRLAHGTSDSTVARAGDVFLKERRKLILVPRDAPYNLIHLRNMATLTEAGATIIPASPSFYTKPKTIPDLVDTIIARVLDHLGVEHRLVKRWQSSE